MTKIIHSIHFPVSARSFVAPIVVHLNHIGIESELWLENHDKHQSILQEICVPKQYVSSDLPKNIILFWKYLQAYRQRLISYQPDVLHSHQARASVIPLLAGCLAHIPVRIYHNHGLPYLGYRGITRALLWTLEFINIRLATHLLFVSRSNMQSAIADGLIQPEKANILGFGTAIGIDLKQFQLEQFQGQAKVAARKTFDISEDAFVLAYVGRPVKRKGLHFLLESWEQTQLAQRGGVLLIAGCTAEECDRALGRPIPGVKALGYMNNLIQFYAASDVVTLPSRHEGFPYSLLEAAAAGKPLLGTQIPGICCAIEDGKTGLLVPFDDTASLAQAILALAQDEKYREFLGSNARSRVEEQFSRALVLNRLVKFYKKQCALDLELIHSSTALLMGEEMKPMSSQELMN
jgi:N,N'-diacetylbacillosaminyl-diphospho-undecaprenol alpha-1,3-N-acetylgalactosaminyltransferase